MNECAQKCWDNTACEYFVKSNSNSGCYLKKNYISQSADNFFTSSWRCDPSISMLSLSPSEFLFFAYYWTEATVMSLDKLNHVRVRYLNL